MTSHGFYHLANRGRNVIGCLQLHIVPDGTIPCLLLVVATPALPGLPYGRSPAEPRERPGCRRIHPRRESAQPAELRLAPSVPDCGVASHLAKYSPDHSRWLFSPSSSSGRGCAHSCNFCSAGGRTLYLGSSGYCAGSVASVGARGWSESFISSRGVGTVKCFASVPRRIVLLPPIPTRIPSKAASTITIPATSCGYVAAKFLIAGPP